MPLVVQQTHLDRESKDKLQKYADKQDLLYQDLWIEAINDFLEKREAMRKQEQRMFYLAGGTAAVAWSMKLPKEVVAKVKRVAKADHASVRRLYYTSLMLYIDQHINAN